MRRIVLLILLSLVPVLSWAQGDFSVVDGELIWRKVYTDSVNVKTIAHNLRSDGHFKDIEAGEGIVTAEIREFLLDYKDMGYKRMSLPIYIYNDYYSGFVTVQVREGRYRVTVERIMARNPRLGNGSLDALALDRKGNFEKQFLGAPCDIISRNFDSMFSKLSNTEYDEW